MIHCRRIPSLINPAINPTGAGALRSRPGSLKHTMKEVVVDFESYYDNETSVSTMGVANYVKATDAYILSIVSDDVEFCGTIAQVREAGLDKLATDPEVQFIAANSNFDQAWWEKYFPKSPNTWKCVLDKAAFHQFPRDLAGVARAVLHLKLDKSTRDEMKGVDFFTLPDQRQQQVVEYCLNDSLVERDAWRALPAMSPIEERLAEHTRLVNRRGVHVNLEKVERDITLLEELRFNSMNGLPWVEGGAKPLSYAAFAEWCASRGSQAPPSLDKRDTACVRWMTENPQLAVILKRMRTFRGSNSKAEKLRLILNNATDDGRIPLDLLYCAARHTRRWSSRNINVQNLDSKRVFEDEMSGMPFFKEHPEEKAGIFMREYFIPPPGKKFLILDYSQIEPRCLNWLVGNEPMLEAIRHGYGIYEAHAKATMKWTGQPGTMKKEFPDRYKFAKMRALALGYGMGWNLFQAKAETDIGIKLTEAQAKAQVADFRLTNPLITGFWKSLDQLIRNAAHDREKILELTMPSGDLLRHFAVRGKGKERGYESYTTRGDFSMMSHQPRLWGGTLAENITQRMARDLLGMGILNLEDAGLPVCFHAHDEVVLVVDASDAVDALDEAKHIMSIPPAWCPDIPLGVDGGIHDHYTKLE